MVAVGYAEEFQLVWTAPEQDTDPGTSLPAVLLYQGVAPGVGVLRFISDKQMGPGFIKIRSCFPHPVKVCGTRAREGQAADGPAGPVSGQTRHISYDAGGPWSPVWGHLRAEGT